MFSSSTDSPVGLSPRTRGSRHGDPGDRDESGSIPAHAGEPLDGAVSGKTWEGLSPRTRGSRLARLPRSGLSGSIPAHAGEPLFRDAEEFAA